MLKPDPVLPYLRFATSHASLSQLHPHRFLAGFTDGVHYALKQGVQEEILVVCCGLVAGTLESIRQIQGHYCLENAEEVVKWVVWLVAASAIANPDIHQPNRCPNEMTGNGIDFYQDAARETVNLACATSTVLSTFATSLLTKK